MVQIIPVLSWMAAGASLVLLIVFGTIKAVQPQSVAALAGAYLVSLYAQFVSMSSVVNGVGLVLQAFLAIYLAARVRMGR